MKLIITSVEALPKNRVLIYVNNIPSVNCLLDIAMQNRIHKGMEVSEEFLQNMRDEQRFIKLKQKALSFATYKPRTEAQVRKRMLEKEFTPDEANEAIKFLKEFGYLDDKKFAQMFIGDYLQRKPSSEKKIFQELKKRGVADWIIEEALNEFFPKDSSLDLAREAAEKKLRTISYKPEEKQKSSLVSYLQRQGFSWDIIKEILKEKFLQS